VRLRVSAALVAALLLLSCGAENGGNQADPALTVTSGAPRVDAGPSLTGPTTSTPGPRLTTPGDAGTPTTPATTTLPAVDLRPNGPPPWSAGKITGGDAYRVGLNEWLVAENRDRARLVLPADVGLSAEATPRPAYFGGGWAVAWDERRGPGVEPTGAFCETCGRGVAGIAGTGTEAVRDFSPPFTNVVRWSDGSAVGYTGPRADNRQFLAYLYVNDQDRLYHVWSYISQRHLEYLLSQLRFVEGAP
jgi:hypothetical protein